MANNLLAVDLSYQSYRAAAAHPGLTSDGRFTGGLFGFFSTLGKLTRECEISRTVICTDTKPYRRSLTFPEYKAFRKSVADPELKARQQETNQYIREVFDFLGVPCWSVPGFESDDLIGHLATRFRHRYDCIYAGSNDSDLFQLLTHDRFAVVTQDYATRWTMQKLREKHDVDASGYMLATALMGTHNDLPGIPKVGEKTALRAVKEPSLMRDLMNKHWDIIDRNMALIKLPHADFPASAKIPRPTKDFNPRRIYQALGRFDIEVTAPMITAVERMLT